MSIVRIYLLDTYARRENNLFFINDEKVELIKEMLAGNIGYWLLPPMQVSNGCGFGLSIAEDIYDLTNNPDRQTERLARYGNGQSISGGDIVEVDGLKYLCKSMGWALLY